MTGRCAYILRAYVDKETNEIEKFQAGGIHAWSGLINPLTNSKTNKPAEIIKETVIEEGQSFFIFRPSIVISFLETTIKE